ncbi:DUF3784 domain-containing protein [Bacillus sp. Hm123]|uniref:DUF3784 domain-containing protein n=1 Tax=Bacillus sp. Hm123 TaxID=3450745 RepID=UPI003F43064D
MSGAIVHLVIVIPFFLFAIVLSKGKGAFLIAGYNTMPEHEKEKYNEEKLCQFMSKIMYGICFSLLLWAFSELFNQPFLFIIGLILFISLIVFTLVYANTGNRFEK